MKQLDFYLEQFKDNELQRDIYEHFSSLKSAYDATNGGDAEATFLAFVHAYNWFGKNKSQYNVSQNAARNFVGALMQDWLAHLLFKIIEPYHDLRLFSEVRVRFGYYPVWKSGQVSVVSPSELSDLCIGYLMQEKEIEKKASLDGIPQKELILRLPPGTCVVPLITVNSKIRISQGEFFDWQGRETLMTKGNPHCLSTQVALRKEMDINIVEAAQAYDKWFLLGEGSEIAVLPRTAELQRFLHAMREHLEERMQV